MLFCYAFLMIFPSFLNDFRSYYGDQTIVQARKRKLGLLEDDDLSQMTEAASSKEQSLTQAMGTAVGKNRGILVFFFFFGLIIWYSLILACFMSLLFIKIHYIDMLVILYIHR